MKNLTTQDYQNHFNNQVVNAFYLLAINDPSPKQRISNGIAREFKTVEAFLTNFDFMAAELPLSPADYTPEDWEALGDYLSECDTQKAEEKAFETCPQSIDPINY